VNERIESAIAHSAGPALIYNVATIAANMRALADAARAAGIAPLFALKSFPLAAVHAVAGAELAGFDAASPDEVRIAVGARPDGILSIVDPSGAAIAHAPRNRRVIIGCDTLDHVRAAPPHAEIAIRISASLTGRDPAIGAIADGTGHRRSRFGLDGRTQIAELVRAARAIDAKRPIGIHVHHGPVTAANAERFIATARAAIDAFGGEPTFINLGGAWHGIADHASAFAEVRAALGNLEIFVEPGRAYAANAGFATGRVLTSREIADRIVSVVELSRICHLRWSQPDLVAPPPHAEARRKLVVVGPTCYEEDIIGEWTVDPSTVAERVVLSNVTGYALAWNTTFAGVPAANVVVVD